MDLKTYMLLQFNDLVARNVDEDELLFILDCIYAEYIDAEQFMKDFDINPDIRSIIKILKNPETREELIRYGERFYTYEYYSLVGNREYTASKAYYDGISNPDEVEYGDGYPVHVYDVVSPKEAEDTDFGMHFAR